VFDSVRSAPAQLRDLSLDSQEAPQASVKDYPEGNMGPPAGGEGRLLPGPPVDSESDLRAEMLSTMGEMGVVIEKHHHEVGQSQHDLGMKFGPLTKMADALADL